MTIVLVTGSGGLVGSAIAERFLAKRWSVVGVDNNMRMTFFGDDGSVAASIKNLSKRRKYKHCFLDIRDRPGLNGLVKDVKPDAVVHCAAQPSHDYAARAPELDFDVNAVGTMNLLEAVRKHAFSATFVHMSTNKVYGDLPNKIRLCDVGLRLDFDDERYAGGIDESMSIDDSLHSVFGASKVAADVMVQEYAKYFGMRTCVFRGSCLTGPNHAGVESHGFLSHFLKCCVRKLPYRVYGYDGKQVRDQIHCSDVAIAIETFLDSSCRNGVYNIGGGRSNSASILELASVLTEKYDVRPCLEFGYPPRLGDHACYITCMDRFVSIHSTWKRTVSLDAIIDEMITVERAKARR